jgi:hypothetical protein
VSPAADVMTILLSALALGSMGLSFAVNQTPYFLIVGFVAGECLVTVARGVKH